MMDCGNCGYWRFNAIEERVTMGFCQKVKGPHYNEGTPYDLKDKCWEPEGGKGPRAEVEPRQLA